MGVWIETRKKREKAYFFAVTPFVGVWIETLKYLHVSVVMKVTPFVGVWIETYIENKVVKEP